MSGEKYLKHYKNGFIKYIPEFLIPKIRPKIVDSIIRENDIIGKIAGINLKPINFNDESQLREYSNAILELKDEDYSQLFIEEYESLSKNTIHMIEDITRMKISDGEDIKITNLPLVMKSICSLSKESLEEKEILVICDDKEKTKTVIKQISKDVRFVTAIGCEEHNDEIYNFILEETGLSLFFPSNIDRILENYSIIINFIDNYDINFSKVKRNCIVFNFGKDNSLGNKKRPPLIEDFAFNLKDLGIKDSKLLKDKVHSNLFEGLAEGKSVDIKYLYSEGNYYHIEDYVNLFIKVKGKF